MPDAVSFLSFLKRILNLCMMRAGPQDMPASFGWMAFSLAAYLMVSAVNVLPLSGWWGGLLQAVVETAVLVAWVYGALMLTQHPQRLVQTLTALAGSGAVMGLLLMPQLLTLYHAEAAETPAPFAAIAYLITLGWMIAVFGRIFRHALDLRQGWLGVATALGFMFTASLLIIGFFGGTMGG